MCYGGHRELHPVGQKLPNAWELYDTDAFRRSPRRRPDGSEGELPSGLDLTMADMLAISSAEGLGIPGTLARANANRPAHPILQPGSVSLRYNNLD